PLANARLRADARGRDGGVREELTAGAILVCAANCPIGENNSSLEMARGDESTLDNDSLRILTLSYARKRHLPRYWVQARTPRFRGTGRYGISGPSRTDQSGLMPADFTTLAHFSVSSAMSLPKSAGESASTSPPSSASRAFMLASPRPALISLLSFST